MPPVARAVLLVLAALAGAVAGVLGSFAHPDEVAALPVGLLLGLGLSVAVFVTSGLLLGRAGAAAAAAGWLGTVLLMSSRRPEGDLVVPATATGYAWLLVGTLLAGVCIALPYSSGPGRPMIRP